MRLCTWVKDVSSIIYQSRNKSTMTFGFPQDILGESVVQFVSYLRWLLAKWMGTEESTRDSYKEFAWPSSIKQLLRGQVHLSLFSILMCPATSTLLRKCTTLFSVSSIMGVSCSFSLWRFCWCCVSSQADTPDGLFQKCTWEGDWQHSTNPINIGRALQAVLLARSWPLLLPLFPQRRPIDFIPWDSKSTGLAR